MKPAVRDQLDTSTVEHSNNKSVTIGFALSFRSGIAFTASAPGTSKYLVYSAAIARGESPGGRSFNFRDDSLAYWLLLQGLQERACEKQFSYEDMFKAVSLLG